MNIKDIRYRTFSTMVETLIVAGVVNNPIGPVHRTAKE